MRILDNDTDKKIDNITLCLTRAEASELKDTLEDLLKSSKGNHGHVTDYESNKEITLCIYDQKNLDESFPERIKKLITEDI